MKALWARIQAEPALVSGAVIAICNALVAFGVWNPTQTQMGTLNVALAAVLAIFTRSQVQPKT